MGERGGGIQLLGGKIFGVGSCAEGGKPEIYGVGTALDCGLQRIARACGGEARGVLGIFPL